MADDDAANVARISSVEGNVQVLSEGQTDFQQAVINMPVLDGSRLQTGADGKLEVEFNDGSVARLAPNSSLQVDHLGQDRVQLQQMNGLGYYEFNVGDGHPHFVVTTAGGEFEPTANAIVRMDLDQGAEVAVLSGGAQVTGGGGAPVKVAENQSVDMQAGGNGAPLAVAQGIKPDSWDQWNQDRDQSIAQEASQQTPVRDDAGSANNENWNDLDSYGDWYPVAGAGNVWVPSGVSAGWDPYGAGYWGYYPGGYSWISAYPWGWLPYHCGAWSYYSFGWGWVPGGCGGVWSPFIGIRFGPPGYVLPVRPVWRPGMGVPLLSARLVAVDRGAAARGPWTGGRDAPLADHSRVLNINGHTVAPIPAANARSAGFAERGTSPGVRASLGETRGLSGAHSFSSGAGAETHSSVPAQGRSGYTSRPNQAPHYSSPPRLPSGGGRSRGR